jgi:hypothetical protein
MKNSAQFMTRTTVTAGIAGRSLPLRIMLNMEDGARGKLTTATQYPREGQTILGILFLRALNVIEANVIAED